ncbi:hypothetical protein HC928_09670 [bacterium]|nr:hypothetical protein [bacterium]
MPFERNPHFVGRMPDLLTIADGLRHGGAVACRLGRPVVAAIVRAEWIIAAQIFQRQPLHPLLHRPQRHAARQLPAFVGVAAQQQRTHP